MADMDRRVRHALLFGRYAPLLTEHRRELLRLYYDEDLSLQEIGDQLGITRQGACDAIGRAERQLEEYERKMGFVALEEQAAHAAQAGLEALKGADGPAAEAAREQLITIIRLHQR